MGNVLTNEQIVEYELEVFKFIQKHCIYRVRHKYGECKLLSSRTGEPTSAWQMYCMRALMHPRIGLLIGMLFWEKMWGMWQEQRFQIAGVASSGVPIPVLVGLAGQFLAQTHDGDFDINGFVVRKEKKVTGLCNWTEGMIDPDLPILLVDDIVAGQTEIGKARTILTEIGYEVLPTVFALVRFTDPRRLSQMPCKDVRCFFTKRMFSLDTPTVPWEPRSFDRNPDLELDLSSFDRYPDLTKDPVEIDPAAPEHQAAIKKAEAEAARTQEQNEQMKRDSGGE